MNNKLKFLIYLFGAFVLFACNDPIPNWVLHSALSKCGGKEKVHQVFYDERLQEGSVTCKNGIFYSIRLNKNDEENKN
jgi:hypothetical protein